MASEVKPTRAEEEFIAAVEASPVTQIEVIEAADGKDLVVTGFAVDPDTAEDAPVSITLDPGGDAFVVTIAREEIVIPRDESSEKESAKDSPLVARLRQLHDLATRVEQEAKGKARQLAERLRLKRND
jgi:hypothetical protein